MIRFLIAIVLPAQIGVAMPADSVDVLRRQASRAEAAYERLSRQRAPSTWQAFGGSDCDEIVGRFCLRFDSTASPPAVDEDSRVEAARSAAVDAARAYFTAAPYAADAAGPLVRLLLADGRAPEAVPVAQAFAALAADGLHGQLLLGLALHAAGADSSAELHFARGLARLPPDERAVWLSPEWLIDPREWSDMRRLPAAERAELERRFWITSDPFWMTGANERWVEHMARWAQARLLADVPQVTEMLRWGRDLDQLTIRYGVPVARSRSRASPGSMRSSLVEYWDSTQRAYSLDRPSRGVPPQPAPGERPGLYSASARSAYAYAPVTRVLEMNHQATRFMVGDDVSLRIDGVVPQPVRPPQPVRVAILAYDSAFATRRDVTGYTAWQRDSARFTLRLELPPGRVTYSVEALDTAFDVAARARFSLDELRAPMLSDILITRPFAGSPLPRRSDDPVINAHASLVFARGDTLGLYTEVYNASAGSAGDLKVELSMESLDRPSLLGELVRWIGRGVGIGDERTPPVVTWRADGTGAVHVISFDLPLDRQLRGQHALVLRVTDASTGTSAESRRRILIVDRAPRS